MRINKKILKLIIENTVEQDDYDWADNYLNNGLEDSKRNWDYYYYLDVTGRLSAYYTLWMFSKYNPKHITYIQNISMDFKKAVINLKQRFPNKHIEILSTNSKLPHLRNEFDFPFGKYINKNLYDVAKTDKKYIMWAAGENNDFISHLNIEVVKNPYTQKYTLRKLNNKQLSFINNLKAIGDVLKLEKHGVTNDNKSEKVNINLVKFKDLLNVLKSKYQTPFVKDYIFKIENGADTTTFSEKVNSILADLYSKSFTSNDKFNEMFKILSGKNAKISKFEIGKKYESELKFFKLEKTRNQFNGNEDNIYIFLDNNENKFINYTSVNLPIELDKKYKILFTYKKYSLYKGEQCHFIKNLKIK